MLRTVTPSDSIDLPNGVCKALIVGSSGNLAVIGEDDSTAVTIFGLLSGQPVPVRVKRVMATNTSCTNITALY